METRRFTIRRVTGTKRTGDSTLEGQVSHVVDFASRGGWKVAAKQIHETARDAKGNWVYAADFTVENPHKAEWQVFLDAAAKAGTSRRYNPYPWRVEEVADFATPEESEEKELPVLSVEELRARFPVELLDATDREIEDYPAFAGIYGRGPQIRILLSAIWGAISSDFTVTNHCLLHGLPSCAKSQIIAGLKQILGEGGYLSLNMPSTTKAGVEKLFLQTYRDRYPRVVFMEETEKSKEEALEVYLPVMDDRREVAKINYRTFDRTPVFVLCIGACNDKQSLDRIMGGKPRTPGALSSRFVNQLYVPRPNRREMERILEREVENTGGDDAWVDLCLELMDQVQGEGLVDIGKATDPRWVKSWLDGKDRLETGEYQEDLLAVLRREKKDRKAYRLDEDATLNAGVFQRNGDIQFDRNEDCDVRLPRPRFESYKPERPFRKRR